MARGMLFGALVLVALSMPAHADGPYGSIKDGLRVLSWTGFYAGVSGGYAWGRSDQHDPLGNSTGPYDINGGFGGGTIGYNRQISNWVFGLEVDLSAGSIKGGGSTSPSWGCVVADGCVTDVKWFGTARGRLGYATGPWLFYGTGGAAYGQMHTLIQTTAFNNTVDHAGWVVGGGVEYAGAPRWSLIAEYLHLDFGNDIRWTNFGGDPGLTRADFDLVRAGVNYRF
jgi:outer membrane immunogenic protein